MHYVLREGGREAVKQQQQQLEFRYSSYSHVVWEGTDRLYFDVVWQKLDIWVVVWWVESVYLTVSRVQISNDRSSYKNRPLLHIPPPNPPPPPQPRPPPSISVYPSVLPALSPLPFPLMMNCCLMSSGVSWHIRDKLRPMRKHGSVLLYVYGNHSMVQYCFMSTETIAWFSIALRLRKP